LHANIATHTTPAESSALVVRNYHSGQLDMVLRSAQLLFQHVECISGSLLEYISGSPRKCPWYGHGGCYSNPLESWDFLYLVGVRTRRECRGSGLELSVSGAVELSSSDDMLSVVDSSESWVSSWVSVTNSV